MSQGQQSQQDLVNAVYEFAAEQMRNGVPDEQVESKLVEQGLDAESAATVVSNLATARSQAISSAGKKNMAYGALWCIGGIIVTAATYNAAAANGGGKYVVTYGAIIYGAIQFFRGITQLSGK